ncbi:E2F/DP family winged-helix DNA-binding domain-domain-containing protein [Syncephalastrum racemosum]|uniref:E2F/DP family winged-helix DNA-binding domain-domain-containing protein n=1 Tax=Syncephalastrum racemosum TaxID=13706 RepID=A0A1X2H9K8_SYNRA|nr:E2F/DP family winged-helix DNA-binding domain-domain-containing protein [Syncephalastrum racemosum]
MTSAFVPFQPPSQPSSNDLPTPAMTSLPSPPLYGQRLYDRTRLPINKRSLSPIDIKPPELMKNNNDNLLPSYGFSLPPLQHTLDSIHGPQLSPLSCASPLSSEEDDDQPPSRKGSIASILNSDPELRQLDEEEHRNGFQSHFSGGLKRGRPCLPLQSILQQQKQQKKRKCSTDSTRSSSSNSSSSSSSSSGSSDEEDEPKELFAPSQRQPQQRSQQPQQEPTVSRRSVASRAHRGLRHFSKQVCDKVAEKGVTTYNEVADELALDIRAALGPDHANKRSFDQKNIRRRVYDALNVLMAMNIIAKDKKQIRWLGVPSSDEKESEPVAMQDRYHALQQQIEQEELRQTQLQTSVEQTEHVLRDKIAQHLQLCNLIWHNQSRESEVPDASKVALPFFIVACPNDFEVDVAGDSRSAVITHSSTEKRRAIYEDASVLGSLGFNRISYDHLSAWLPDEVRPYTAMQDLGNRQVAIHNHLQRANYATASS